MQLKWINPGLRSIAVLARQHASCRADARASQRLGRNVPYEQKGRNSQVLDIFAPKDAEGSLPIVFYVHGGGFSMGSKETHTHVAQRFAAEGYLVFNIDYRLGASGAYPAALEDVCAALNWVLDQAADYGGDLDRLVYAGESAGANLILALTLAGAHPFDPPWAQTVFQRAPNPKVILPACGILEVHRAQRFLDNTELRLIYRKRIAAVCEGYLRNGVDDSQLASPLCLLESPDELERPLPAIYTLCGGADPILEDSERLERARQRLGLPGAFRSYPDQVHAFHLFPWLQATPQAWLDQMQFLDQALLEMTP